MIKPQKSEDNSKDYVFKWISAKIPKETVSRDIKQLNSDWRSYKTMTGVYL